MSKYVFLFKENGTDDRDCVRYIELENLIKTVEEHLKLLNI